MAYNLETLQQQLDYTFSDPSLAKLALTHRSASRANNERLEFLGDALLDFIIGEALFNRYPDASEGELSRWRAAIVKKEALASVGRKLQLGDMLLLGAGEAKSGGRDRDSLLADCVEALVAAVYLDAGLAACRQVAVNMTAELVEHDYRQGKAKDFKTRLQELLQSEGLELPQYEVVETRGEAHEQRFFVTCSTVNLPVPAKGQGSSKRAAEQEAARHALEALNAL